MKCKECGHEIEEEYWVMWSSTYGCWEKKSKPIGELRKAGYCSDEWEYFVEEDYFGDIWFWRRKR